jgi:hypothetical protein
MVSGDYDAALGAQSKAAELSLQAGDLAQAARNRAAVALTLGYLRRADDAHHELDDAVALATRSANPTMAAFCDYVAGELVIESSPRDALPRLTAARDAARELGNRYLAAIAGVSAVSCASRLGQPAAVLGDYTELLDYFDRTGSVAQQWTVIRSLIETLASLNDDEAAAVLLSALDAAAHASPLIGSDATRLRRLRSTLRRRLGKTRFEEASSHGRELDDQLAFSYARYHAKPPSLAVPHVRLRPCRHR